MLYEISNLIKTYEVNKATKFTALDILNLKLPDTGFVSIVGKSGSGKSSFLNILSLMDKPTNGCVKYKSKDILKYRKRNKLNYIKNEIGIIFQNYHLINDQSVLFNIALPMMISGHKKKDAETKAKELANKLCFQEELLHQKIDTLSGGEKQRVCLLRALINNPNVILCDEPTGALDTKNSHIVMDILKKESQTKLVIMVSHNLDLVNKYSDQIIEMKDGKIIGNKIIRRNDVNICNVKDIKVRHRDDWSGSLVKSNIKKRWKRDVVSFISIGLCLIFTFLVIGFVFNYENVIQDESNKHLNLGVCTLSKQINTNVSNSVISLVQDSRPSLNEISNSDVDLSNYYIELNYDALIPSNLECSYKNNVLDSFSFHPVYTFTNNYLDESLLIQGDFPTSDTYVEGVINQKAYDSLLNNYGVDIINKRINICTEYEYEYYSFDENNRKITDIFEFNTSIKIKGIVKELSFLSTPSIYYSFIGLEQYMSSYRLDNLSQYLQYDIYWKDIVLEADNSSEISSYSYRLFPKDISKRDLMVQSPLVINNQTLTVNESLSNLLDASSKGVELFLIITIIACLLIVGIISYSSFSDDIKRSAILSSLGCSIDQISLIYLYENYLFTIIISLIVLLTINPVVKGINWIIEKYTGLDNMIFVPSYIFQYKNLNCSTYLFVLIVLFLVVTIATYLPIVFSKCLSPKEEFKEQ